MKKVTIQNLIEFQGKNQGPKSTFVNNLKKEKKRKDDEGGNYWMSCLSAIRNTFKTDNTELLDEKITLLNDKIKATPHKRVKDQFRRNIEFINSFKEYEYQLLKPEGEIEILKKPKNKALLDIHGLPVEAKPCHVYKFKKENNEEIGGVWFIAKLGGYKKGELGMFSDMMYRYLEKWYFDDFYINPDYCIAVDLFKGKEVKYSEVINGDVPILIDTIIQDFKKY